MTFACDRFRQEADQDLVEVTSADPLLGAIELLQIYSALPVESRSVLLQLARLIGAGAREIA